nr:MAG TPA: hypothetical protein [Caudoviricetes sp.]
MYENIKNWTISRRASKFYKNMRKAQRLGN